MIKRIITLCAVLTFLFTALLSGCGGKTEKLNPGDESKQTGTQAGKPAEPKKITFWRAGTEPEWDTHWKQTFAGLEKNNIKVETAGLPWGNEIETKLNAAYASGTGPDLLHYSIASIAQRAGLGQYASLDDYISKWSDKDDIMESIYDLGKYKGKIYGLGWNPDPRVFVWRKDLFQQAGLDPEKAPKDWKQLAEYAVKLTKKEGNNTVIAGFNIPIANGFQTFQIFSLQNGVALIDVDKNDPLFDKPDAIEAAAYLNDLVKKGVNIPVDQFKSQGNPWTLGNAAMSYESPQGVAALLKNKPDLAGKIGVAPPLENKAKGTFCGLGLFFISADSKNKDAAWEAVKAAMTKEEMMRRYKELGTPIVRKSLKDEFIKDKPEMNKATFDAISVGQGAAKVIYSTKLNDTISQGLEQAYYGKKSAEQAMKDAAAELRKEIPNLIGK